MIGIYFSGTGNTRHCVERFVKAMEKDGQSISIEDSASVETIKAADVIVFAYPIYWSNLPKIVRDFIEVNSEIWKGKKIFIITTMGLFSGDGAGCSARLFKKYGALILGGLHLKMPDCIGDVKLLKKTLEENRTIVKDSVQKLERAAARLKNGRAPKQGLGFFCHIAGLFGQRLWFYKETRDYTDKLKIDVEKCIGCGRCTLICSMNNIYMAENKAAAGNSCTKCYRCIANCPGKAITLLGKRIYEQSKIEKYL